jgi:hypothetical protein
VRLCAMWAFSEASVKLMLNFGGACVCRVEGAGVTLHRLTGDDIKPHHWDSFYRFYLRTCDKKFGRAYLTRDFFDMIGQTMADQVRAASPTSIAFACPCAAH